MINKNSKIFIAGHNGLAGSAILKKFKNLGYKNIHVRSRKVLNLLDQKSTFIFLKKNKFDAVISAAAKVGGIIANNKFRGEFIYENLQIQNNLIHGAFLSNVKDFIFLGSSCVYPKNAIQPIKENSLLSNCLEKTNEPYAIAKIAGIKMCESYNAQYGLNYKCLMPANLYGINDNYNLQNSHFFSAIIRKVLEAKKKNLSQITLLGSGKPKRELMLADHLAEACAYFIKKKTHHTLINIGSGLEMQINEFANEIKQIIYPELKIKFDNKKKFDGVKRKIVDRKIASNYGWTIKFSKKQLFQFVKKNIGQISKQIENY